MENKPAKIDQRVNVANIDFLDFSDMTALMSYAQHIYKSEFNSFNKVEDVVAAFIWAKDKGLPIIDCLQHLHVINGKIGADSHLMRALLQRAGIVDETIEDAKPIYGYQHNDLTFTVDDINANPESFKVFFTIKALRSAFEAGKIEKGVTAVVRTSEPVDIRTKIKFTRWVRQPNGEWIQKVEYGIFTWQDAVKAELVSNNTYNKYLVDMLYARAYTRGARRIGGDILHGLKTKEELIDVTGQNIDAVDVDYTE